MLARRRTALGLLFSSASLLLSVTASAGPNDPKLRHQRDMRGDVAVFGSTLAHDCGTKAALPVDATASCEGQLNIDDTAPDIYWRDNVANATIEPSQARTSATLVMPPGAKVVYARLYWAAIKQGAEADTSVTLDWAGGPETEIKADATWSSPTNLSSLPGTAYYQATGDATEYIAKWGAGDFRVTGVDGLPLAGLDLDRAFTGWTIVVFYENPKDEPRNLALFDGFTYIAPKEGTPKAEVTLQGFLVPPGFDAKMTAFTYEGDFDYGGDSFTINGKKASDALNPVTNFFNSSRSNLGQPVTGDFDVPKLSGQPGIMSGYDLDTVDITSAVKAGDKQAIISAESDLDIFILGGFVTSIRNLAPDFDVFKTAIDLNGGALLPGDEVEYVIDVENKGNDSSISTTIKDVLEPGLDFTAGSLKINGQSMTDPAGDDRAEYDGNTRTITWYVGNGAASGVGGEITVGQKFTVSFRAKIASELENGAVANQAVVRGVGKKIKEANPANPGKEWLSDGDPDTVGPQKTVVTIKECQSDAECGDVLKPHCNTTTSVCEPCKSDADCSDPALPACQPDGSCNECSASNASLCKDKEPACNVPTGTCTTCTPATGNDPGNAAQCQGNPDGTACVAGSGGDNFCGCVKDSDCGGPTSGRVCDTAATQKCIDGCRGEGGNGCDSTLVCTSKDTSIGQCVNDPEDTDAKCSDGKDNDGDGKTDCDDSDCKNSNISACKENTNEKCKDGKDNDGDSQTDCDDADCKNNPAVTVCDTGEDTDAKCSDGKDNDGDGKIDCDDDSCHAEGIKACGENTADKCKDKKDNDGDGLTDCADPDCLTVANTSCGDENTDAKCKDGIDNDGDGKTDCDDDGCSKNDKVTVCPGENTEAKCSDGVDNDNNGKIDCADPGCESVPAACGPENTDAKCSDGKDNDGDGQTDCADPDCGSTVPCGENTDAACQDGIDNDADGKNDCEDEDCKATGPCADPTDGKGNAENTDAKCKDGLDNDGDGKTDCSDTDCRAPGLTACKVTDAGVPDEASQDGGCGCTVPGQNSSSTPGSALALGLAAFGLLASRRRRSR